MSLFNLFKKESPEPKQSNILLAMPMFNDGKSYHLDKVIDNLKEFWSLDVTNIGGDGEVAVFNVAGEEVALANMPVKIPLGDIKGTAKYAYNWPLALKDLEKHSGHAIVSVMASQNNPVERFKILSKVLGSILMTSEAVGVYQGSQSLLIPRSQYLGHLKSLEEGEIPVMLWIYLGLRETATGNCAYTYGLKDFQKTEIEIIDSKLSLDELFDFLFSITSYVIGSDITLKSGESIGLTAEQKVPIRLSKAQFVGGQSLKLEI